MKKVVLFGVGERFSIAYPWIQNSIFEVIDIWDNDEKKRGKQVDQIEIGAASEKYVDSEVEIVITNKYVKEIKNQLLQMGYEADRIHDVWWIYFCRMMHFYDTGNVVMEEGERQAIEYIKKFGLTTFNIELSENYAKSKMESGFDRDNEMHYVIHNDSKLYLCRGYGEEAGICHYYGLKEEQDKNSPHCYAKHILFEKYDCIVDGGCCEGIFALDMTQKCDELFLIEPDHRWIDTYQYTFRDLDEKKLHVIQKGLGKNVDAESYTTLDTILENYLKKKKKILIKIDIEGAEEAALEGASRILNSDNEITIIACAYHHVNADTQIESILKKYGFEVHFSERNMFFRPEYEVDTVHHSDEFINKSDSNFRLRHGLVVGYKNRRDW